MDNNVDINRLRQELNVIEQQTILNASRAAGSWLSIHFSHEMETNDNHSNKWGLYVYEPWVIQNQDTPLVSSNENQQIIDERLKLFRGDRLTSIAISEPSFDLILLFESGLIVKTFTARGAVTKETISDPYWTLVSEGKFIFSVGPGDIILFDEMKKDT